MFQREYLAALIAIFLLASGACTHPEPAHPAKTIAPLERVGSSPVGTSQTVLQKTFNLKVVAEFPFEIPAHAAQPHLHGLFESFAGQIHSSDDSANIDFLILNEEQQADAAGNRVSDALFSVEGVHNQAVNFDLPPSLNRAVRYYLVFRNPGGGKGGKVVEANFRVDF
jgi:hypothetical protein